MGRDEVEDWEEEYAKCKSDPQSDVIEDKLRELVETEAPDTKDAYSANPDGYRNYVTNFRRVKKTFFSNVNPRTLERARSGDTDGAIDLLHEMGIVTKKGLED